VKVREKELAQHQLGSAFICTLLSGPKGVVGLAFFVCAVTLLKIYHFGTIVNPRGCTNPLEAFTVAVSCAWQSAFFA
jgi:hypothetical protein